MCMPMKPKTAMRRRLIMRLQTRTPRFMHTHRHVRPFLPGQGSTMHKNNASAPTSGGVTRSYEWVRACLTHHAKRLTWKLNRVVSAYRARHSSLDHPCKVLLEQVDRHHQQNKILQKEAGNDGHGRETSRGRIPRARNEGHDREGGKEGRGRTERAQHTSFFIPEPQE